MKRTTRQRLAAVMLVIAAVDVIAVVLESISGASPAVAVLTVGVSAAAAVALFEGPGLPNLRRAAKYGHAA